MPKNNSFAPQDYDPRWFVWTIVFLVVTGVSLVAFIVLSDSGGSQYPDFPAHNRQLSQKR